MCGFMGLTFLFCELVKALEVPLPSHAQKCFDAHHGLLVELIPFSQDPAVLGSRLVPNALCVSREN